ncbi:MAG: hypothetical protein JXB33_06935 [Clostridia bacterium]|nr:hypothetical protein [Clostridia bacterium]
MTETLINGGLASLYPKSVWISCGRTAACISDSGIVSCIYHGMQAVSRNSYILRGGIDEPAIKFVFRKDGTSMPHEVMSCRYSMDGCRLEINAGGHPVWMNIHVLCDSLHIETSPADSSAGLGIDIELKASGRAVDVYGNRSWSVDINENSGCTRLTADDRTMISEWVERHGSFLIPIEVQNGIYDKDPLSDISFSEQRPVPGDQYIDGLLIKARIMVDIGSRGLMKVFGTPEHIVLSTDDGMDRGMALDVEFSSLEGDEKQAPPAHAAKAVMSGYEGQCTDSGLEQPVLTYPAARPLEELFSFIPSVFSSVIQDDTGMPRACAGGYYWVWGWDTIVAAMEMSKWGGSGQQKRIISFMLGHRWKSGTIPHRFGRSYEAVNVKPGVTDSLFLLLVKQYLEDSRDYGWLNDIYAGLRQIWAGLIRYADEEGFITGLGTYPDNPRAMGRNTRSRVAIDSGSFYFALACMLGFAEYMGDDETAAGCRQFLDGFEERYISGFFDEEKQMVFDSFSPEGRNLTYPVYSLVSMAGRQGITLLLQKQEAIAEFIENEYFTEAGFRALPSWDRNKGTECIHHSWFLYWDVCVLALLRTTGRTGLIDSYRDNISLMWENYRTLFEFIDLDHINSGDRKFPWSDYGCSWPIHGTASVYRGILEGLLGLRTDMGCITVLPGPVPGGSGLTDLTAAGRKWNFAFRGEGGNIRAIMVNGIELEGSMVVPESMMNRKKMDVVISRDNEKPKSPVIADIFGGRILEISKKDRTLGILVKSDGFSTILLQADEKPAVMLGNKALEVHGIEGRPDVHYVRFHKSGKISIG